MEKKSKKKIMRIEEVDKGIPIARTWYHTGGKRERRRTGEGEGEGEGEGGGGGGG